MGARLGELFKAEGAAKIFVSGFLGQVYASNRSVGEIIRRRC